MNKRLVLKSHLTPAFVGAIPGNILSNPVLEARTPPRDREGHESEHRKFRLVAKAHNEPKKEQDSGHGSGVTFRERRIEITELFVVPDPVGFRFRHAITAFPS